MTKKLQLPILGILFLFFCFPAIAQQTHPAWSGQSNIYEVNLRQYTASSTIKEFEKQLPRLRSMGVDILWFMPITPIGLTGRKMNETELGSYYAVKDYKAVNPEFGTMADWKAMVKHAHALGFKVITDWVANHAANDNGWIKTHSGFFSRDSAGNTIPPYDWTDVRKLNYNNKEMRDSMIDAMKFWLRETGIDGFRCDVAGDVPDDFWKECIDQLNKVKKVFMLAEGEAASLHTAGFDATYSWNIMREMGDLYSGKQNVQHFDSALNHSIAAFPADAYRMYFTSNHDENSWNGTEFEKYGDAFKTFAVFTQTIYQSVPLIYSGQEIANKKRLKFFVKDPIDWGKNYPMASFYRTLLNLRKSNPALAASASYKKLTSTKDNAVFAYARQQGNYKVVVILNLSKQAQQFSISDKLVAGNPMNVFMGVREKVDEKHVFSVEPWGYIVYEYR